MNRRDFITTATAAVAIPALPTLPFAKAAPATTSARYWAIYMTELNGDVTPATLGKMTGLTTTKAAELRSGLIAQNILKPTGFVSTAPLTPKADPKTILDNARKTLEYLTDEPPEPEATTPPLANL